MSLEGKVPSGAIVKHIDIQSAFGFRVHHLATHSNDCGAESESQTGNYDSKIACQNMRPGLQCRIHHWISRTVQVKPLQKAGHALRLWMGVHSDPQRVPPQLTRNGPPA